MANVKDTKAKRQTQSLIRDLKRERARVLELEAALAERDGELEAARAQFPDAVNATERVAQAQRDVENLRRQFDAARDEWRRVSREDEARLKAQIAHLEDVTASQAELLRDLTTENTDLRDRLDSDKLRRRLRERGEMVDALKRELARARMEVRALQADRPIKLAAIRTSASPHAQAAVDAEGGKK